MNILLSKSCFEPARAGTGKGPKCALEIGAIEKDLDTTLFPLKTKIPNFVVDIGVDLGEWSRPKCPQ